MGLVVGEAFKDSVYVYDTATGAPEIGAAVTCVVIDQAGNRDHPAGGAVAEEGLGWYSCTWTPDAAGTWKTEWGVPAGMSTAYPFKLFLVGAGQEADILTDTNELQTDWTNGGRLDLLLDEAITDVLAVDTKVDTIDGILDNLHDTDIPDIHTDVGTVHTDVDAVRTRTDHNLVTYTWFSTPQETVDLHAVAANESMPSVILPNITGTITEVHAGFFSCMKEATAAGVIGVDGAQHIQVKESAAGAYVDAISIVDHMFSIADTTREGGPIAVGDHDIVAQVAAFNKTYNFQWTSGKSHADHLRFSTVQTFLMVSYY